MNEALADALTTIGDRWTLLVIAALLDGPRRFGDLQADVDGIAPNVLTQRLRQLERNALVVARPYSERPPRFVYELTAAGQELAGALRLIAGWGRPQHRGRHCPSPRGVRHADGGALVVSDLRAHRRGRRGRAGVRLSPWRRTGTPFAQAVWAGSRLAGSPVRRLSRELSDLGLGAHREVENARMLRLVGIVISIGLADSLNPSTIAPALYLATGERGRERVAEFTFAVFAVYFLAARRSRSAPAS